MSKIFTPPIPFTMHIEQLRDLCLSFPGTSEGIKYGDQLCFMVMGKVFCSSNIKQLDKASFKVSDEIFPRYCSMEKNHPQDNKRTEPTKSELEILQVLWQVGPSTVRTVNAKLNEQREVNYSSTLKLMQLMEIKGLLQRDTNDRSHVYRPSDHPEKVQSQVVRGLRDLAFGGSTSSLVLRALGTGSATPEELEEIKRLIEEMQKKP